MAVFLFGENIKTSQIVTRVFYIGDFLYNFSFLLISILTIFIWGLKSKSVRIKRQSIILVLSSIIPFVANLLTQTILPLFTNISLPGMGQLYAVIMIVGCYIVITKYKFLRLPEKFIFEEITNEMLDMIIIINEIGQIIRISRHTLNMLGFEKNELLQKNIDNIIDSNNKEQFLINKMKESNNRYNNIGLLKKNGDKIPVNISSKRIFDSKIHDFLGVILVIQDISLVHELQRKNEELHAYVQQIKAAEEELKHRYDQNLEMERLIFNEKEQLKTTLLSVGDGVISTDEQGNIELINKVGEQLTGWTQREALGNPLEKVFNIVNEFTRKQCDNPVIKVLKTRNIVELDNNTILISKGGIERSIEDSAAPIMAEDGSISGVVLVFRDFTEKKERQNQIEYLSYHDQLTGLYNRRFFEEEVKRLDVERNFPITIVMADVNGLKLVNDSFGHSIGDELLKKVAEIMEKGCRADDIVARLGGDEFVIVLPKTDICEAEQITNRIKALSLNAKVGSIEISVSFGYEVKMNGKIKIQDILKKAEDRMYKKKIFESPSMRGKTIQTIISTLHEKNKREEQHSKRVSELCKSMAEALGLHEVEIEELKTAGLLHDIGKIAIDENILNKPGKLTNDEWEEIMRHPEIGYRILNTVQHMSEIANYVLAHHERWDGTGYPKSLKGEEIPLQSRIIAVADAFDAMTSERSYRNALSEENAILELEKNARAQFDPQLVRIFIEKVLGYLYTAEG
jgi:PAS domain S-box/diguanylate cyclase (GGDEF) domain/uncharacterized domain HDIG